MKTKWRLSFHSTFGFESKTWSAPDSERLKRSVRPESFPRRRIVVAFEFTDAPPNKSRWWLVSAPAEVDLCLTDPGYEVDLFIATDGQ